MKVWAWGPRAGCVGREWETLSAGGRGTVVRVWVGGEGGEKKREGDKKRERVERERRDKGAKQD